MEHTKSSDSFWPEKIQEWKESALTKREFCRQQGLSVSSFDYRYYQKKQSPWERQGLGPATQKSPFIEITPGSSAMTAIIYFSDQIRMEVKGLTPKQLRELIS
jgi:hypothetical protein